MLIGTAVAIKQFSALAPAELDTEIDNLIGEKLDLEQRRETAVRELGAAQALIDAVNERLDEALVLRTARSPELLQWGAALAAASTETR